MSRYRGVPRSGSNQLLISEVFGPTLQGEGPSMGQAAVFVRLGMCNLACSWCDTSYTWDSDAYDLKAELTLVTINAAMADVLGRPAELVVVTGGEPLLQAGRLMPLIDGLCAKGRRVEIETNGTIAPGLLEKVVSRFVVSPKLTNSKMSEQSRLRWASLEQFADGMANVFKFVATSPADLDEVEQVVTRLNLAPGRVWVMPEGRTQHAVLDGMRSLAPHVTAKGWSLSSRMHVLLWGDSRGM